MKTTTFLAMTGAEIAAIRPLPPRVAWMACHFSPYGTGLSNLPEELPPGALLILNDRIPICRHDPQRILAQLRQVLAEHNCAGLLLDFQRANCPETLELVRKLCQDLTCPLAVSEQYAKGTERSVFLPPLPHHIPLADYLSPWKEQSVWLELAMDCEVVTLTEDGASVSSRGFPQVSEEGFVDETLHCHYRTTLAETTAEFTLWRTAEDVRNLLTEAARLGIQNAVGLYQEFKMAL